MHRLGIIAGMTLLPLGSFSPQLARACTCYPPSLAELFLGHSLIFSGTVTHIVPVTSGDWSGSLVVVFDKDRFWKGKDIGPGAIILTSSGLCGYPFVIGEKYVVFARSTLTANAFGTGLCHGNSRYFEGNPTVDFLDRVVSVRENSWGGMKRLYTSEDK